MLVGNLVIIIANTVFIMLYEVTSSLKFPLNFILFIVLSGKNV